MNITVKDLREMLEALENEGYGDNIIMLDVNEHYKTLDQIQVGSEEYEGKIHLV